MFYELVCVAERHQQLPLAMKKEWKKSKSFTSRTPSRPTLLRRYKHSVRPSLSVDLAASLADMKQQDWLQNLRVANPAVRECMAEFFGTFLLVLLGNGVVANTVLGKMGAVGNVVGPLGWGLTVAVMVITIGGVSGGHVNPAVTVALATVGKARWSRVLPFLGAQYLGAFVASCVLYGIYKDALDYFDNGVRQVWETENATAHIFATYPQPHVTTITCFFDQVVGTALLLIAVSGVGDERNTKFPLYLQPLAMCISLTCIIFAFGYNCQAALNPARDLAPRIFTAIAGWGNGVFSYRKYNWFWVPVLGPHLGGILGVWMYKMLVELHWPPSPATMPMSLEGDMKAPWRPELATSPVPSNNDRGHGSPESAPADQQSRA